MFTLREAKERGHANHGWLDSYHTFSFADYYDPRHMSFGALRVINEDVIDGGTGFPTHGHKDMEIITYIIEGALQHKDSMGTTAVIRPGEVQTMSAGTGVRHSEFNHLENQKTHLLQIWIMPAKQGIAPAYGQKKFEFEKAKGMTLVVSQKGIDGSLPINQDANIYVAKWQKGETSEFKIKPGRRVWIQMVKGSVEVGGENLSAGDALGVTDEVLLKLQAGEASEFLFFDLF